MGSYLDDCLSKKVIFFTGKGGVGKSSLAWATALACRRKNKRVTLANWSPFDPETQPLGTNREDIDWIQLDTMGCFKEYALQFVKFDAVYNTVFNNHVLQTFIKAAPGLSETVISGKIWSLYARGEQDLLIVDLPSSGHALSFFQSPLGVRKMFSMGFVHKEAGLICSMFGDASVRIDLVALPEEMSMVETHQLYDNLKAIHPFHFGYLHINQCTPEFVTSPSAEWANAPAEVRECVLRYEERKRAEKEALLVGADLPMPHRQVPLYTTEYMSETIHRIATDLESA